MRARDGHHAVVTRASNFHLRAAPTNTVTAFTTHAVVFFLAVAALGGRAPPRLSSTRHG
jgi:hypothetical protein